MLFPFTRCGVALSLLLIVPASAHAQAPTNVPTNASANSAIELSEAQQEGLPLRDGERVLFRFRAPADAAKVFVAGSFNNYADNVNGAVTDEKYAMTNAGNGIYFARVFVEPKLQQYKFVVLDKSGQTSWMSDPSVVKTDADGNSVLDFSKIERIPAAANRQGPPVRDGEQVLFRFRALAGAQKVFLAGSFNGYGDNENGIVSDDKFAMTPGITGLYTKRVNIGNTTEKYKFVVVDKDGKTVWMTDPNVEATDEDGNSVVNFGAIEKLN